MPQDDRDDADRFLSLTGMDSDKGERLGRNV